MQLYLLFPLLRKFYKHPLFGRLTILFVIIIVYFTEDLLQSKGSLAFAGPYFGRLFSSNAVFFVLGFYLKDYALVFTQYTRKTVVILTGLLVFGVIEAYQITHIRQVPDSCEMTSLIAVASAIVTLLLYML
jgi:hypothetical protein